MCRPPAMGTPPPPLPPPAPWNLTCIALCHKRGAVQQHRGLRKWRKVKVGHALAPQGLQPAHRLRPGGRHLLAHWLAAGAQERVVQEL